MFFLKVHPACHNIANGIKPGSNSNLIEEHAAECSNAVYLGCKMICVKCINCSHITIAKGIHLLDKIALINSYQ